MPLGNPIRKQNESRMVSVLATEGQTVFTVQGGYIINHISVFRNGVRLSNSEDFTAGDGSTVTLNNAANIDDRIEFHIFDRFTVQNAIVSAASTQTISGDVVVNGKIFGNLDVPSINVASGIVTTHDLNVTGIATVTEADVNGDLNVSGVSTFTGAIDANGGATIDNITIGVANDNEINTSTGNLTLDSASGLTVVDDRFMVTGISTFTGLVDANGGAHIDNLRLGIDADNDITTSSGNLTLDSAGGNVVINDNLNVDGTTTVDGTVSIADSIVHTGDTNTSLRFPTNDTFTVETSGSERIRITSTGSFGVGTNSPSQTFHVHGDSGSELPIHWIRGGSSVGGYLYSDGGGSGIVGGDGVLANTGMYLVTDTRIDFRVNGSERLRIDSSGRILVAHTSSQTIGGNGHPLVQLNVNSNQQVLSLARFENVVAGPSLILGKSRASSAGNYTVVQNGDGLGNIAFAGADGTDLVTVGANIEAQVDGTPGSNDMPGRLVFSTTADGASSPTERLRIHSDGIVTVGNDPSGAASYGGQMVIATTSGGVLTCADTGSGERLRLEGGSGLGRIGTDSNHDLVFITNGTSNERMRIDSSGHLLLGTTTKGLADYGDMLTIADANAGMTLRCAATNQVSHIYFADGTSSTAQYAGYVQYNHSSDEIKFGTSAVTRFTIDSDGAVTQASNKGSAHNQFYSYSNGGDYEQTFRISNASAGSSANMRLLLTTYSNQSGDPYIKLDAGGTNFVVGQRWAGTTNNSLVLGRGETPSGMDAQLLMRGDGDFYVGSNGDSVSSNSGFYVNASGSASSSVDNGYMDQRRRVGSGNAVAVHRGTQGQLQIHGDGDCENTNNNYSGISDVSLKENIVDASSQWDDIKAVKVRKFNFKPDTGYSTDTHIGVVAQELESVSPNLVKEVRKDPDPKATDTSTIKSVKYSVLYMKSVKALQEAMTRIETLEAKVAALEGS